MLGFYLPAGNLLFSRRSKKKKKKNHAQQALIKGLLESSISKGSTGRLGLLYFLSRVITIISFSFTKGV